MAVDRRPKLTYQDYELFPDDGKRRELIDGELHVTPSPNTRHQDIVRRVLVQIDRHLEQHGGGRVFVAPYDVVLFETDVVQPDVIFVSDSSAEIVTDANIRGAPTLVVEVLSDPARDRKLKRDLYGRLGVSEYWVIDPDADRVEIFRAAEQGYSKPEIVEPGEILDTQLLPGLRIDVAKLLAR